MRRSCFSCHGPAAVVVSVKPMTATNQLILPGTGSAGGTGLSALQLRGRGLEARAVGRHELHRRARAKQKSAARPTVRAVLMLTCVCRLLYSPVLH